MITTRDYIEQLRQRALAARVAYSEAQEHDPVLAERYYTRICSEWHHALNIERTLYAAADQEASKAYTLLRMALADCNERSKAQFASLNELSS